MNGELLLMGGSFLVLAIAGVSAWHVGRVAQRAEHEARRWRDIAAVRASRIAELEAEARRRQRADFQIFFEPMSESGETETA